MMRKDADLPPTRLRRRKYLNVALLIIDLWGAGGYVVSAAGLLCWVGFLVGLGFGYST